MTKAELVAALSLYNDDEEIFIETPSGDYWKTDLARPLEGVERLPIATSDYHRGAMKLVDELKATREDRRVVVLLLQS